MKTEKKSANPARFMNLLMIPALFLLFAFFSSCNKAGNTGTAAGDDATKKSSIAKEEIPFVQVEEMPVYADGDIGLLNFIKENAKYPEEAKKNNITGKVIVRFVVKRDCTVSDVTVLQGVDPLLDAEAIRVVSLLKFEKPARNEGKDVPVWYMVPISFSLK
jgi:protein TonB